MTVEERAFFFECLGQRLLGVASLPDTPADVGIVVVVGGPQYRTGSHRQFVSLARRFASEGFAVLRFDYRGMGDSEGERRAFETVDADIGAAIDALQQCAPSVRRVALWGLCDGASAALMYVDRTRDTRVAGLAVLNPWVRSQVSLARTHVKHYYVERLRQRQFWTKLLSGKVAWSAVAGLGRNVRAAMQRGASSTTVNQTFQDQMASGWRNFGGSILLLLSENDYTAREFLEYASADTGWQLAMTSNVAQRVTLLGADHTCSTSGSKKAAENETLTWLSALTMGAKTC